MGAPLLYSKGPMTVLLLLAASVIVMAVVFQVLRYSKGRRTVEMLVPFTPVGETLVPLVDVYELPTASVSKPA